MRSRQESDLRLMAPRWVPRPPWLSITVLQHTSDDTICYLGGCILCCRPTSATFLQAQMSVAIILSAHGSQSAPYLSCQSTASLCTRLKGIGGDVPALNLVVRADDRLQANFLQHEDQWRLEALRGTCSLPLSVNRAPTSTPIISAGVHTARAWRAKTRWLFQIKSAREVPLQYLWL
jgi:hypothetical protein